ncbi:MAG TPA: hypothetical protein DDZ89_12680, partial [Clostridiales bacterium]|nr:hypothetical protein [Clostridiales bacterium]
KLLTTIQREIIYEIFQSVPKYKVNKRFYTGKSLDLQDTFQLFADKTQLYTKTRFVNTKAYWNCIWK